MIIISAIRRDENKFTNYKSCR